MKTTAIRPISIFQEDWPDGWYERFAGAFYAQQPAQEPMTCGQCGHRYTSYLWGRAWDWCPACTYGEIREDEVHDLRTRTMELGRRLGLGWKGTEYIGLPLDEREKRLESLLAFIQKANRDWRPGEGERVDASRDLEDEYDRQYAAGELPVLGRRPPGYTGWASGSDNGGSSCHHDAARLNAPPMMFSASRCSFVSSTSPDCTRASPASSTFNVSIIALTPEFSTIWLNISRMGISRSISVVIPHTPRPLLRPPRGPFWAEIRKVHAFRLFRVWILRQPPPHRGGPEI